MKYVFAACLVLFLSPRAAHAQQKESDTLDYIYPGEIIITAPRIGIPLKGLPFSTTVVPGENIRAVPRSVAMDEPLKLVPGVKVDNQANGSRVHLSIRGQGILTERGIRGIKILLDDIPLNDPTGFAPDFFDVDFNDVNRIEVLRGPAASIYGGGASGGIINILTREPLDAPLSADGALTLGSNNFWKAFTRIEGGSGSASYQGSLSRTMGDGYRDHTHFRGKNFYAKATYAPAGSFRLTPILSWSDYYHENPEGINLSQYGDDPRQANPDAIPYNEYLQTERTTGGLTGSIGVRENHEVTFNAYLKHTLFTEANNRTFNHRTINTPGTSWQYTIGSGAPGQSLRNRLSAGTDLQWQTIDEHRNDNLYGVEGDTVRSKEQIRQRGLGFFVIDNLNIGERSVVMASLRYDNIHNELVDLLKDPYDLSGDADFSKVTGRVGLTYTPSAGVTLFTGWGQGFMPPATEELAQNPDQFGGFNTHLTSATSNGFEAGSRGTPVRNLTYEITGFYLETENDFDRYRITDPLRNQETFYRNAGSSDRLGVELFAQYTPAGPLNVQLAYTYSHFRYTNATPIQILMDDTAVVKYIVDGNRLPNAPEHQLYADVQYSPFERASVGFSVESQSTSYIDGANVRSEAAPAYTLFHARLVYAARVGGVNGDLTLSMRNIANRKYVAFTEPDPGGNAYQPGAGREIFGGIRFRI
jgi:iron complex outermembrane receptor protein